jgi:hypothetical protein
MSGPSLTARWVQQRFRGSAHRSRGHRSQSPRLGLRSGHASHIGRSRQGRRRLLTWLRWDGLHPYGVIRCAYPANRWSRSAQHAAHRPLVRVPGSRLQALARRRRHSNPQNMGDSDFGGRAAFFAPRDRVLNQQLISELLNEPGWETITRVCAELQARYSASIFAEFDWQEFRPDAHDENTRQVVGLIDDFIFFWALPSNIGLRFPNDPSGELTAEEANEFALLFDRWQQAWLTEDRGDLLHELDEFIQSCSHASWDVATADVFFRARERLATSLATASDISRVCDISVASVSNTLLELLDLPWTRRSAKSLVRQVNGPNLSGQDGQDLMLFPMVGSPGEGESPIAKLTRELTELARLGQQHGLRIWSTFVLEVVEQVKQLHDLHGNDGQWSTFGSPCGRCGMWFVGSTMSSLDTTCGFVNWSNRRWVFIPAGACTAECWFCGFTAPVNAPAMFFAAHRDQVVYHVPTQDLMSDDDALEYWRSAIEGIRARYLGQVTHDLQEQFESAAELVTHNVNDFLYAIHMGETIAEDHVVNVVPLPSGEGLLCDGEKRFARVITPYELLHFTETTFGDSGGPAASESAQKLAQLVPDRGRLDITSRDAVQGILLMLIDRNDAFDAQLLRERQSPGT